MGVVELQVCRLVLEVLLMFIRPLVVAIGLALLRFAESSGSGTESSIFFYQGQLMNAGQPANALYDFRFVLYDSEIGGSQIGSILTNSAIQVTGGLFQVSLDFGAAAFDGNPRWLEIAVRSSAAQGFSTLDPRQAIRPAPYAIHAGAAQALSGSLPVAQLQGTIPTTLIEDGAITTAKIKDHAVTATKLAPGAVSALGTPNGTITNIVQTSNAGQVVVNGPLAVNRTSAAYILDVYGGIRGTSLVSDYDLYTGGYASVGGNLNVSGSTTINAGLSVSDNVTANGGKGIVRSANSTQLALYMPQGSVSFANVPLNYKTTVNFAMPSGMFASTPRVSLANISNQTGDWSQWVLQVVDVTTSSFKVLFYNAGPAGFDCTGTLNFIAIGPAP